MHYLTLIIIAANVLISLKGFNDLQFFNKYKFQIAGLQNKEYVRYLSSGFLHVDITHLLFNMLTLYFFADVILQTLGIPAFIIIYFVSLLTGNIWTFLYHKNELAYSAVGASGAVSGIVFSSILLYPDMSLYIMFIPIPIPAYIVGIAYLAYSLFGMKNRLGNIGHTAHLGGAIAGLLIPIILAPSLLETRKYTLLLLALPIVLFFIYNKLKSN